MTRSVSLLRALLVLGLWLGASSVFAQQTGSISGTVRASDGSVLPGVSVEARSDVLPQPRTTVTGAKGDYRFPALPPGSYAVKFDLAGMQSVTRNAQVQLSQDTVADAELGIQATAEVSVTATVSLVDRESATIAAAISTDQIEALPVGQDYRDLQKLIPGVQYTEDTVRGPSAGGSEQDNVYMFDGANVTLPLFGTLSAEPASHDIDQVTVIRGGAKAVDFDRAGGFLMDSVSKSGTAAFHGQVGFQIQAPEFVAEQDPEVLSRFEQDRIWFDASIGGPILKDSLFFYGSYYHPEITRENSANLYGALPEYDSTRNEYFGKLTFTPVEPLLFNVSYRDSKRVDKHDQFAANAAPTTGAGSEGRLKIGTAEVSYVINNKSFATARYNSFENQTLGAPDFISDAVFSSAPGTQLDIANLDTLGRLTVPLPIAGAGAYNAFIQPLIDRYGYVQNGVRVGGGLAGYGSEFNDQDFFRDSFQAAYNLSLGTDVTHEFHVGYQWYSDQEELVRRSNGWGLISVPGGNAAAIPGTNGQRAYYTARFQQQSIGQAAPIKSEYESQSIEVNDTIRWNNFTFNVGVLASNDTLYGQGLREDPSTLSGYVSAPGNQYEMYEIPFEDMIQPRISATWAYDGVSTIYASYAKYNPAASSLPRAASWDRNLIGTFIDAHFDQNGVLFATQNVGSSSGKLFVEGMTPRTTDEYLLGTSKEFGPSFSARLYGRYREGSHFWEDTNNTARTAFNPPEGIPRELYIPNLAAQLAQIGSGSTYVIADLDGAYTEYIEATLESEWRSSNGKTFAGGAYTYMRYYGNFDQDDATASISFNTFIGSSLIADAAGRQLWDFKDGDMHGERPHLLKLWGAHSLPWNGRFGAFVVAQSGQPWETWSYLPYRALTTSTSDDGRLAEPAGSRRADSHWQMDFSYTQNFQVTKALELQIIADLYNVFDNQTGYNVEPRLGNSRYGNPRSFYAPRRLNLAARVLF